jgi:hypothetical protein
MGEDENLRRAIDLTYTANVQNTVRDVLIIDLIRSIGALVLDEDVRRAASVSTAVWYLRNKKLLAELEAEYRVVPPLPPDAIDEGTPPEVREAIKEQHYASELDRNMEQFATLLPALDEIEQTLLKTDVALAIKQARDKAVAHYDVLPAGDAFKVYRLDDSGLTFALLDEYVDKCTIAIDRLSMLARHASFDFGRARELAEKDVGLYISALVTGLDAQRKEERERKARRRQQLFGNPGGG